MSTARHHAEWLSLVPVSGPFLSLPVLVKAFPQGLDAHEPEHAQALRMAFDEWNEGTVASDAGRVAGNETRHASRTTRHDPHATHHAWIRFVLTRTLDFDPALLLEGQAIPQTLQAEMPEHHEFLRPNYVLVAPNAPPATHHPPPITHHPPPITHHPPPITHHPPRHPPPTTRPASPSKPIPVHKVSPPTWPDLAGKRRRILG